MLSFFVDATLLIFVYFCVIWTFISLENLKLQSFQISWEVLLYFETVIVFLEKILTLFFVGPLWMVSQ